MRRSAIRCSRDFTSHPWSRVSKNHSDVGIEHPVHAPLSSGRPQERRAHRCALRLRSEPVGEAEEVRLVDRDQRLDDGPLDNLVLQRRYAERSLPARQAFGMYARRTGFARYAPRLQPFGERSRRFYSSRLAVVLPRLAVDARRRVSLRRGDTRLRSRSTS